MKASILVIAYLVLLILCVGLFVGWYISYATQASREVDIGIGGIIIVFVRLWSDRVYNAYLRYTAVKVSIKPDHSAMISTGYQVDSIISDVEFQVAKVRETERNANKITLNEDLKANNGAVFCKGTIGVITMRPNDCDLVVVKFNEPFKGGNISMYVKKESLGLSS